MTAVFSHEIRSFVRMWGGNRDKNTILICVVATMSSVMITLIGIMFLGLFVLLDVKPFGLSFSVAGFLFASLSVILGIFYAFWKIRV